MRNKVKGFLKGLSMVRDYSQWDIYDGASEGSGRSEKVWLINQETKEIGLFKFTKSDRTTEHVSEKLASDLAGLLGLESAKVEIGKYNSRIGSMSYLINAEFEERRKSMSIKDGRDYIYLVWKELKTRRQYIVGQLSKNGQFEFNYGFEVNEAIEKGFKLLISFEDIDKVYKSDILFPVFSSRLPDKKRKGIDKILLKYGLEEYDEYRLLKRSGARLPIDNLEFIDPILEENNGYIKRNFYLAGTRHYIGCDGVDC